MLELRSAITISRRKMRQPRSNYLGVLREEKKPRCCSHFRPPRAVLAIDAPAIHAFAIRSDRGRGYGGRAYHCICWHEVTVSVTTESPTNKAAAA